MIELSPTRSLRTLRDLAVPIDQKCHFVLHGPVAPFTECLWRTKDAAEDLLQAEQPGRDAGRIEKLHEANLFTRIAVDVG